MRAGRGRELQFFATNDELVAVINAALPAQFAPYHLVGLVVESGARPRDYQRRVVNCPIGKLIDCLKEARLVWIGSTALGHEATVDPDAAQERWSLSGLTLVDHGFERNGRREASRIAIVNRVRDTTTGDVETNEAAEIVFDALRSAIRDRLRWSSVRTFADGSRHEDDRLELMTEALPQWPRDRRRIDGLLSPAVDLPARLAPGAVAIAPRGRLSRGTPPLAPPEES